MRRDRISPLVLACGALALVGCFGGSASSSGANAGGNTTAAAAQALTAGITFSGGKKESGPLPPATDNSVMLMPLSTPPIVPGNSSLMSFSASGVDDSDPPALTLVQFNGASQHFSVPVGSNGDAGSGLTSQSLDLSYSVMNDVCKNLCDIMFSLQVKAAVKLASGKISAHGTGNVFLDCTSTGNHARCASQPHLGGAGTSGCNETRTDCVAHGGGGTGGTSTGLKICTPGQQSVPGAANDPCPQICTGPSYAICGVEGMWGECMCSDGSGGSGGSSVCGNNVRESVEQCDGADLNAATCSTLGLGNGILLCDPATCTYDSSMCNSAARDAGSSGGPDASMTTTDGGVSQCPPSWHCDTSVGACVQDGSNVPGGCNATCTQYSGSCSDPYCIILCG